MRLALIPLALAATLGCGLFDNTPTLPEPEDPCAAWAEGGLYRVDVEVDGRRRRPYVFVPQDSVGPRDVVIMLHGAGGSGTKMLEVTDWRRIARERGMVASFPNGSGAINALTWNAGDCCGFASETAVDDVAFLDALADTLRTRVCADRVIGVGHSNGGMMVQRWACEGNATADVFVSSAGALVRPTCPAGDARPLLEVHGRDDDIVPYEGGKGSLGVEFPGVDNTLKAFQGRNGCDATPAEEVVDGDTTCSTFSCEQGALRHCAISDWGHEWPGGTKGREAGPAIEALALSFVETFLPVDDVVEDTDAPEDTDALDDTDKLEDTDG